MLAMGLSIGRIWGNAKTISEELKIETDYC